MTEPQALGNLFLSALEAEQHEGGTVPTSQPADRNAAPYAQPSPRVDCRKRSVADLLHSWQERLSHLNDSSSQLTPPPQPPPPPPPPRAEADKQRVHTPYTPPQSMRAAAPSRGFHVLGSSTAGARHGPAFIDEDGVDDPIALHVLSARARVQRGRREKAKRDKDGSASTRSASSHSAASSSDSTGTGSVSSTASPRPPRGDGAGARRRCRPHSSPSTVRQPLKHAPPGGKEGTGAASTMSSTATSLARGGAANARRPESARLEQTATPFHRDLSSTTRTAAMAAAVTASAVAALRLGALSPSSPSLTPTRVMNEYEVYDFGSSESWAGIGQLGHAVVGHTVGGSSNSSSATPVQREVLSATRATSRATSTTGSTSGSRRSSSGESDSRRLGLVRKMSSNSSYELASLQYKLSSNLGMHVASEQPQLELYAPVPGPAATRTPPAAPGTAGATTTKGAATARAPHTVAPTTSRPAGRGAAVVVVKAATRKGSEEDKDTVNVEDDDAEGAENESDDEDGGGVEDGEEEMIDIDEDEEEDEEEDEDEGDGCMTPLPDSGIVLKPAKDAKPTVDPVTRWRMSLRRTHVHTSLHERRLIPLAYFRKFYIAERFVEEDEWCVTYLVRERGTSRHLYAKFIRMEPTLASPTDGAHSDAKQRPATSFTDAQGTPLPCLSAISVRRCAMLLAMQHPHLLRCRDVFTANEADGHNVVDAFNECVKLLRPPQPDAERRSESALSGPRKSFRRAAAFFSKYTSGSLRHKSFSAGKEKSSNLGSHSSTMGVESVSIESAAPPPTLVVLDASQLGHIRRSVTVMAATAHIAAAAHGATVLTPTSPPRPQGTAMTDRTTRSNSLLTTSETVGRESSPLRWRRRGQKDTGSQRDDEAMAGQQLQSHKSWLPSLIAPAKGRKEATKEWPRSTQDARRVSAPAASGPTAKASRTVVSSPPLTPSSAVANWPATISQAERAILSGGASYQGVTLGSGGGVVTLAAGTLRGGMGVDSAGVVVSERQAKLDLLQLMLESGAVAAVLVFECYDGAVPMSLAATVARSHGLPEDDVARCVRAICEALCYLHRHKSSFSIAHCGVRVANLLRTSKQGRRLTVMLKTDLPIYNRTTHGKRHGSLLSLGRHRSSHRRLRREPGSAASRSLIPDEAEGDGGEDSAFLLTQASFAEDEEEDDNGDEDDEDGANPARWFTAAESGDAPPAVVRGARDATPTLLSLLRPRQTDVFLAPEIALTRSQSRSSLLLDSSSEVVQQPQSGRSGSGRRSFLRRISHSFSQHQFARWGRSRREERHRGLCAADMWAVGVTMYFLLYAAYPVFRDASDEAVSESRLTSFSGHRPVLDTDLHLATRPPSEDALDLLLRLLEVKPRHRITAEAALAHPFLSQCVE